MGPVVWYTESVSEQLLKPLDTDGAGWLNVKQENVRFDLEFL